MTQISMFDVVILGCGPAGIQAATYAKNLKLAQEGPVEE